MMTMRSTPLLSLVLAAGLAIAGQPAAEAGLLQNLAHPKMELPKDFPADMPVLTGKRVFNMLGKKPLEIPPYQVTDFERGPVVIPGYSLVAAKGGWSIAVEAERSSRGYRFKLQENGKVAWEGQCRLDASSKSVTVAKSSNAVEQTLGKEQALECRLQPAGGGEPWALALKASQSPRLLTVDSEADGALVRGETRVRVAATYAIEGVGIKGTQASGFLFAQDARWIGAAEWTAPGSLRLDPTLEAGDRGAVAAASAALLLYNTLSAVP